MKIHNDIATQILGFLSLQDVSQLSKFSELKTQCKSPCLPWSKYANNDNVTTYESFAALIRGRSRNKIFQLFCFRKQIDAGVESYDGSSDCVWCVDPFTQLAVKGSGEEHAVQIFLELLQFIGFNNGNEILIPDSCPLMFSESNKRGLERIHEAVFSVTNSGISPVLSTNKNNTNVSKAARKQQQQQQQQQQRLMTSYIISYEHLHLDITLCVCPSLLLQVSKFHDQQLQPLIDGKAATATTPAAAPAPYLGKYGYYPTLETAKMAEQIGAATNAVAVEYVMMDKAWNLSTNPFMINEVTGELETVTLCQQAPQQQQQQQQQLLQVDQVRLSVPMLQQPTRVQKKSAKRSASSSASASTHTTSNSLKRAQPCSSPPSSPTTAATSLCSGHDDDMGIDTTMLAAMPLLQQPQNKRQQTQQMMVSSNDSKKVDLGLGFTFELSPLENGHSKRFSYWFGGSAVAHSS